ncbi:MAG TPA: glycosyltransferase [Pirellulaceae bacterium]|nr:glycosyltransferase [Pirellulaceae bacterium]
MTTPFPRRVRPSLPLILHVRTVSGAGGGPEKTILNSPRFYGEFGYRALCVYLHPPGDPGIETLKRRAAGSGAHLFPLVDRGRWDLRLIAKLAAVCRRLNVQVWHSHDYKTNAIGLLVRRCWRMAMVTTVHGWVKHTARTPLYYAIDKRCLPWFDQVVCVSEDLQEECLRAGVPAEKCTVIHNGIDIDRAQRRLSRDEAKARLSAPKDGRLIGAVGRLSAEKGFDKLIEAAVAMPKAGRPVHLWIAGEGDARADLESLIRNLGCGDYVRLLGQLSDPATFYQAMDVFALSSYREGLPNVVLEAMAYEAPVVATRVAGVPALVRDGEDGLLVNPGSAEELSAAISEILDDAGLADRLAKSARMRIESGFSFRERTRKVCEIHDRARTDAGIVPQRAV